MFTAGANAADKNPRKDLSGSKSFFKGTMTHTMCEVVCSLADLNGVFKAALSCKWRKSQINASYAAQTSSAHVLCSAQRSNFTHITLENLSF